jgi:molybdopterin molybdotransferase
MSPAAGTSFAEALAVIRRIAAEHRLEAETLPLSRCHGRVLAGDAFAPASQDRVAAEGGPVLTQGQWLGPLQMGRVAAAGVSSLTVSRKPTVAVFIIGDALVEPGLPLAHGQSHDGDRELLMGLLRAEGLDPTGWPLLADDRRAVEVALRDAGCAFDLVVTCGGAPAREGGGRGHVAAVVEEFGRLHLGSIGLGSAGPLVFGSLDQARLLGFPSGADVVAPVWLTLGRALVDGLQGRTAARPVTRARLLHAVEGADYAFPFVPARLLAQEGDVAVEPLASPGAPDASSRRDADAWIATAGRSLPVGAVVDVIHP